MDEEEYVENKSSDLNLIIQSYELWTTLINNLNFLHIT